MEYVNACSESRVWPDLQDAEGRTLELEPGQTVELDTVIEDAWLKPTSGGAVAETVIGPGPSATTTVTGSGPFTTSVPVAAPQPAETAAASGPEGWDVSPEPEHTEPENEPDHTETPATGEEH